MTLVVERYGDVHRLRMSTIGSRAFRLDVSAYVVRGMMIDSGLHRARRELLSTVAALNVRGCVVTHWHEDHAGNAASIARNGIPLMLHPETEAILRRRPAIALYRRFAWGRPPALDRLQRQAAGRTEGRAGAGAVGRLNFAVSVRPRESAKACTHL